MTIVHHCQICGDPIQGFGQSAEPVHSGRCCNFCNDTVVIPVRIRNQRKAKEQEKQEREAKDAAPS